MLRIKLPFIHKTNIPLTAIDSSIKTTAFSIDNFFEELHWVFCQEELFFNLPFEITHTIKAIQNSNETLQNLKETIQNLKETIQNSKETIQISKETLQNSKETWVIATLKIKNIDQKECLDKLLNTTGFQPDLAPNESFHIGFNIVEENGKSSIQQFATNFEGRYFRKMMLGMPLFTKTFFEALKESEYFIYEEAIAKEVKTYYEQLQSLPENKPYSKHKIWDYAADNCRSKYLSLYFINENEFFARRDFMRLTFTYHWCLTDKEKKLSLEEYMSPTSTTAQNYTAASIAAQLQMGNCLSADAEHPKTMLYVGTSVGKNITPIEKAFPYISIFGVEPVRSAVDEYEGNKNKVFLMYAEELLQYPELSGYFDYIIIPNINLLANQTLFWNCMQKLLKEDGKILVGHFFGDPVVTTSPKSLIQEMHERFAEIQWVVLPKTESLPAVTIQLPIQEDYLLIFNRHLAQQQVILHNLTIHLLQNFKNSQYQEIYDTLVTYALQPFKQFFYSGKKPLPLKNSCEENSGFAKYFTELSINEYERRFNHGGIDPLRKSINENTYKTLLEDKERLFKLRQIKPEPFPKLIFTISQSKTTKPTSEAHNTSRNAM